MISNCYYHKIVAKYTQHYAFYGLSKALYKTRAEIMIKAAVGSYKGNTGKAGKVDVPHL